MRRSVAAAALLASSAAQAGQFDFAAAPQTDLNRIYRIDRYSGEVTACQYGMKEGSVGLTLCYGPGQGAGVQPAGDYALMASRHEKEGGVFRVNRRSGEVSVCYVFEEDVVCTPAAPPAVRSAAAPAPAATADLALDAARRR